MQPSYVAVYFSLGQPTTQEKAKLFIKSLDLGLTTAPGTIAFLEIDESNVTRRHVPFNKPASVTRKKRALRNYCPSSVQKICSNAHGNYIRIFVWLNLHGK